VERCSTKSTFLTKYFHTTVPCPPTHPCRGLREVFRPPAPREGLSQGYLKEQIYRRGTDQEGICERKRQNEEREKESKRITIQKRE
jgi:hypothetical protein